MPHEDLKAWLLREDADLVIALTADLHAHITSLLNAGRKLIGYAILPGESYCVNDLVVAYNFADELDPEQADDDYFRFSVDEWQNYDHDALPQANALIHQRNEEFRTLHRKEDPEDLELDEFEIAHVAKLHDSILQSLLKLRREGAFDREEVFTVIWIPDSEADILSQSAQVLNAAQVYEAFRAVFE